MEDIVFLLRGRKDGKTFAAEMYQGGEHPYFTLRWQEDEGKLHIRIIPKLQDEFGNQLGGLTLESVGITFPWTCESGKNPEYIFMNGYQSWTDSHEHTLSEREHTMPGVAKDSVKKYFLDRYGDYNFTHRAQGAGMFHGFTYCYFRKGERYRLIGSLNERSAFTVFYYNGKAQQMTIEKECLGLELTGEWNAFDLLEITGGEAEVFDAYFAESGIEKPKGGPMTGYTSWYNHYQNISERIILDNLAAARKTGQSWDVFQIDDGYQAYVGDWLEVNPNKFPNGLQPVSEAIHEAEMKAGLWLAPFVCERKSRIYQEHPEWLVRDALGQPVCCGSNWSTFFALDLEQEPVREYLREVFHQVLDLWGFDLVKLDFLYAACMLPTSVKSRGQLMCEAMDFLRELVGEKLILGCGVPLGPAFGKVDYCRIGCDVGLDWNGSLWDRLLHRERVSTKNAIGNTIYRRQLDGRAFWNDPDVYLLRENNIKLSRKQRRLLAQVNGLFGSLLFTSDHVGEYDRETREFCEGLPSLREASAEVERSGRSTVVKYSSADGTRILKVKL